MIRVKQSEKININRHVLSIGNYRLRCHDHHAHYKIVPICDRLKVHGTCLRDFVAGMAVLAAHAHNARLNTVFLWWF